MTSVNIAPTWDGILSALIAVVQDGGAAGRAMALAELRRMAALADMSARLINQLGEIAGMDSSMQAQIRADELHREAIATLTK